MKNLNDRYLRQIVGGQRLLASEVHNASTNTTVFSPSEGAFNALNNNVAAGRGKFTAMGFIDSNGDFSVKIFGP